MPILASLLLAALPAAQDPAVELLDHGALTQRLQRLAREHDTVELEEIGRSRGGRAIHALRIASGDAGDGRPALLVVANLDGPQVFSSGVALRLAERLAADADEGVAELLATTAVLLVPRANPDAAEARFAAPLREAVATGAGVDTDRDGREGEDGPADVDGDGRITHMRVPDPEGTWTADPADPRATVEADAAKGQPGRWKLVVEGRDADGDEEASEDPAADAVVNRNFPAGWREHDASAGAFPGGEPAARALMDHVLAHPEIAAVLTWGELDSLVEPPRAASKEDGREIPWPGVMKADAPRLAEVARRYRELVPEGAKGSGQDAGSFQRWIYQERGLPSLAAVLWDVPLDAKPPAPEEPEEPGEPGAEGDDGAAGEPAEARAKKKPDAEPSDDAKRLIWIDGAGEDEAWRFVPWTPFEHPELGPVEVGGFAPYARTEPPRDRWDAIADEQLAFVVALGGMLPRLALAECTARALGEDVWEVEVAVTNDALLPLATAAGLRARTVRPARLRLQLADGDALLAGRPQVLVDALDGAGARRVERWLVRTNDPAGLSVQLDTDGAGRAAATPEVQR